jgi:hypothetical protein
VQDGATETVSTCLNALVCSAVVGRVWQCKISAKYGCSDHSLRRRIERETKDVLGEDQFGFRRGKEMKDEIGIVRISKRT